MELGHRLVKRLGGREHKGPGFDSVDLDPITRSLFNNHGTVQEDHVALGNEAGKGLKISLLGRPGGFAPDGRDRRCCNHPMGLILVAPGP